MNVVEPTARTGPYSRRPSRTRARARESDSGPMALAATPCAAAISSSGRKPVAATKDTARTEAETPARTSTGRRRPSASAALPQAGPARTRSSAAAPSTWPISPADRPRSENHSGMKAAMALAAKYAPRNAATRAAADMARSGGALQGRDFPHLARHRRNAVAAVGGQRLQQAEILQEHWIGRQDFRRRAAG